MRMRKRARQLDLEFENSMFDDIAHDDGWSRREKSLDAFMAAWRKKKARQNAAAGISK